MIGLLQAALKAAFDLEDFGGFFRLDRQLNDRNTVFFRSGVDAFHDTNPNGIVGGNSLPTVARVFRRRTYSEELGETSVLGPTLVNNFRLQFQLASPITERSSGPLVR